MQSSLLTILFAAMQLSLFAHSAIEKSQSDTIINSRIVPIEVLKEEAYIPNICLSADISNFFVSNGYLSIDLPLTKKIVACIAYSRKLEGGINVLDEKKRNTKITEREIMYAIGIKYFHDFKKQDERSPYYLQTMLNYGTKYEYTLSANNIYKFTGGSISIGYCSLSNSGIYTNTDIGIGIYSFGNYIYPKVGFEVGYAF